MASAAVESNMERVRAFIDEARQRCPRCHKHRDVELKLFPECQHYACATCIGMNSITLYVKIGLKKIKFSVALPISNV